jgi:hypothetical protein
MRTHRHVAILFSVVLAAPSARLDPARAQTNPAAAVSAVAAARIDSLRRDSLRRDSLRSDSVRRDSMGRDSARRAQARVDSARDSVIRRAVREEIRAARGSGVDIYSVITLALLALVTGILLWLCVNEISNGHPPALERHWGGFGGAGGGWRMSPSLTYLVIAVLFGILLTVLGGEVLDRDDGLDPNPAGGKDTRVAVDSSAARR